MPLDSNSFFIVRRVAVASRPSCWGSKSISVATSKIFQKSNKCVFGVGKLSEQLSITFRGTFHKTQWKRLSQNTSTPIRIVRHLQIPAASRMLEEFRIRSESGPEVIDCVDQKDTETVGRFDNIIIYLKWLNLEMQLMKCASSEKWEF